MYKGSGKLVSLIQLWTFRWDLLAVRGLQISCNILRWNPSGN